MSHESPIDIVALAFMDGVGGGLGLSAGVYLMDHTLHGESGDSMGDRGEKLSNLEGGALEENLVTASAGWPKLSPALLCLDKTQHKV